MLKRLILGLTLFGLAVTAVQAQNDSGDMTGGMSQDGKVIQTDISSYLTIMPYYLFADEDRGAEVDSGTGFMFGYGRQIQGGFFWEAQAFAGLIETGDGQGADFYQYGLGLDLVYRFLHKASISPFVLAGLGGIYNDVVPNEDDSASFFANVGLGVMADPFSKGGLRLRAGARYIYDRFENDVSQGMSDIRLAVGVVAPLGQRVVQRVKTVTKQVPLVDSDGDGVPDRNDDCPNTLPGALVDSHGCAEEDQNITLQGVKFEFDKATLTANAQVILRDVVEALKGQPSMRVQIAGHTDAIGTNAYNEDLSRRRAASVQQFLVEHGIDPDRLTTIGYGETRPIATNATPQGRQKNRRVVFHILSK